MHLPWTQGTDGRFSTVCASVIRSRIYLPANALACNLHTLCTGTPHPASGAFKVETLHIPPEYGNRCQQSDCKDT